MKYTCTRCTKAIEVFVPALDILCGCGRVILRRQQIRRKTRRGD